MIPLGGLSIIFYQHPLGLSLPFVPIHFVHDRIILLFSTYCELLTLTPLESPAACVRSSASIGACSGDEPRKTFGLLRGESSHCKVEDFLTGFTNHCSLINGSIYLSICVSPHLPICCLHCLPITAENSPSSYV